LPRRWYAEVNFGGFFLFSPFLSPHLTLFFLSYSLGCTDNCKVEKKFTDKCYPISFPGIFEKYKCQKSSRQWAWNHLHFCRSRASLLYSNNLNSVRYLGIVL
jgi:hypothetical protein